MNPLLSFLGVIAASITVFVLLMIIRRYMLLRREKKMLGMKYGDIDMFKERLKEWKIDLP